MDTPNIIDFNTRDIIFISFMPGQGGNFLGRILSMSPELLDPTHYETTSGKSHYKPLFDIPRPTRPGENYWLEDPNKFKSYICGQAENYPYIPGRRYAVPSHSRPIYIETIFPNAQQLIILDDAKRSVRMQYEKVYAEMMPVVENGYAFWKDLKTRREDSPQKNQKEVLRSLHSLTKKRELDPSLFPVSVVKKKNWELVDRQILLSESWISEYLRICKFLNITPVPDKIEKLLKSYISQQWHRHPLI